MPDYVVGRFPTWAWKKNQPQVFFFRAETPLIICKESTLVAIISKSKEQCHFKARSCPFGAIPPKIAEAWVKKAEVLKAQLEYATAVCALLLFVHIIHLPWAMGEPNQDYKVLHKNMQLHILKCCLSCFVMQPDVVIAHLSELKLPHHKV